MADESLEGLRAHLIEVNKQILRLMNERSKLVISIQKNKKLIGLKAYDPAREYQLFKNLNNELSTLSDLELLSFSLLMQAQVKGHYPNWFEGEHIEKAPASYADQCNPQLIKLFRPKAFPGLKLKPQFSRLF